MKAVIIAGGQGTRLREVNKEIPKALFPIAGKTIIEYQIENLKECGISDIILIIGYLGDAIKSFCGDGSKWNMHIEYIIEEEPLGTGGALYFLKDKMVDDFIMFYGDLIMDVDFNRFIRFHKEHDADITLYAHPNSHPYDSDLIVANEKSVVKDVLSKHDKREGYYHNLVNAGIYCLNPRILDWYNEPRKVDLDKEFIPSRIEKEEVFAYRSTEYVKDMGTPDRLASVEQDVESGLVKSRNLFNKQKAIFLDRDGTINVLNGFINSPEKLELIPGVAEAITKLNKSEYLAVVVTNQPVVARGECTVATLEEIHKKMETELGECGAYIDALFYCPHHPDKGFDGEVPELKVDCDCRKPKTGMINHAAEELNIDISKSWFIGDSTMDIQTGINAGMRTVLLHTGECGKDGKYEASPDFEAGDLSEAVGIILSN